MSEPTLLKELYPDLFKEWGVDLPTGQLHTHRGVKPYRLTTNCDGATIITIGQEGAEDYRDAYLSDMLIPFGEMSEDNLYDLAFLLDLIDEDVVFADKIIFMQKAYAEMARLSTFLKLLSENQWIFTPGFLSQIVSSNPDSTESE